MAALYIYKKIAGSAHLIALRSCQQSTLGLFILRMRGTHRRSGSTPAKARAAHFQKGEITNLNVRARRSVLLTLARQKRMISVTELLVPAAIIYQKKGEKKNYFHELNGNIK
jgi:hypothetical protein